jgi:hypothetical protein
MLAPQLPHNQEDRDDDHDHRKRSGKELQPGLRPPVGKRSLGLGGGDDQDREMVQRTHRADLVLAGDRVDEASGDIAAQLQRAPESPEVGYVAADHLGIVRIARDHGAIAVDHRDRGVVVERERGDEILEVGGFNAAACEADDVALAVDDLAGEHRRPYARHLADNGLNDHFRRRPPRGEFAEVAPSVDIDIRHRPHFRGVDQPAVLAEHIEGADMRQRGEPGAQHLMRGKQRHPLFEGFRRI